LEERGMRFVGDAGYDDIGGIHNGASAVAHPLH
jgi:hypothetical protein